MKGPNQLHVLREDVEVTARDLLKVPKGEITEEGLRLNIDVGIQYLESWLRGVGCVPIYNLMEDAATAEICRSQVWQWVRHGARMNDGGAVTPELVRKAIAEELEKLRGGANFESGRFELATSLFEQIATGPEFPDFMTLVSYEYID
jgi:malate synthase